MKAFGKLENWKSLVMKQSFVRILIASLLPIGFLASSQFFSGFANELEIRERNDWLDSKAWQITNSLTSDELVGQTIHIAIPGKSVDEIALEEMQKTKPGGVILFGKNLGKQNEITALTTDLQKTATKLNLPPLLISTDQEGGRVFRVQDGITMYPGAMAVGQTGKKEWGEIVGFVTSYELRKLGINFLFAPILDINNNPFNPVINTRSFGSDISRVSTVAVAYEEGARLGGALPVIKHFPGHGDTNVDSHLGLPVISKSYEELQSLELIPFQKAIENGAEAVMSAHIVYPMIDDTYPATLSKKILTDILREKLKFKGIIITDAMEMHAISKNYEKDKPGVLTILAGANIVLLTSWGETARKFKAQITKAYEMGEFFYTKQSGEKGDRLKEAVYLQIRKKLEMGLYDENSSTPDLYSENLKFLKHLKKLEESRDARYAELLTVGKRLKEVNSDSIKSFPSAYIPIRFQNSNTVASLKNPILRESFAKKQISLISFPDLKKHLTKKEIVHFIFDTTTEPEILTIAKLAKENPTKNFLILHGGNPFVQLPEHKNLTYLFSFSLTKGSWEAIAERTFGTDVIEKVDLILLPKGGKTPEKTAFPERL